jgi:hypothetical protein
MPKRSKNFSNFLMIISVLFAFLLVISNIVIPRKDLLPISHSPKTASPPTDQAGQIEGASRQENAPADALIDTSNWKDYRDPIYHFSIKYPPEWSNPVTKRINDPDFDYEYQVIFGTADTIDGGGFEGFDIFVFQTEKCPSSATTDNAGVSSTNITPNCSTHKSKIPTDSVGQQKILEFSSQVYTYTIIPYIPDSGADPQLVKITSQQLDGAGKTFLFDSTLQPIPKSNLKQPAVVTPIPAKPIPPRAANPAGKRGKLTGAVSSGGKLVCPHPNRKPTKSPNQGNHVDEDCCPDPDEWPNIACSYKSSDYSIMLKVK